MNLAHKKKDKNYFKGRNGHICFNIYIFCIIEKQIKLLQCHKNTNFDSRSLKHNAKIKRQKSRKNYVKYELYSGSFGNPLGEAISFNPSQQQNSVPLLLPI